MYERARVRRSEWADVGKGAVVRDRGETIHTALESPDHLLVVAAGGPAGGFGAVIPPWFGNKTKAVTAAIGACVDCERRLSTVGGRDQVRDDHSRSDPTNEIKAAGGRPAARSATLKGKTVGFISNGKEGTKGYFAASNGMLRESFWCRRCRLADQIEFQRPRGRIIVDEIKAWQAVVTGVGD